MGVVGCTGFTGWAALLCGTTVDRSGHDFLDTSIALSSLPYPRTLIEPHTTGGVPYPQVSCGDPTVCENMCSIFREKGRPGGLPPPEACALCKPVCPNNIATTINDFVRAFFHDLTVAIRLFLSCFGPSGPAACVCNILSETRESNSSRNTSMC